MFLRIIVGTEDCLFLNVYTQQLPSSTNNKLKPVMVWIHGGGFSSGSGNSDTYGPEFLLTEDIVLVTINYRLGVFCFLSFEDASLEVPGNAGLKDMVMALKWVQKNISKFSGDPNNVTIFGESAGGISVHYLILSPLASGKLLQKNGVLVVGIW
jgi:carboxylesterase type B